jgi:orotidine-5'-phosphate decarboxylase
MDRQLLIETIRAKQSFLCVGLDPDPARIPAHLGTGPEAVLAFNRAIIEATSDLAVAYKPNVAFYEAMGADGWNVLAETMAAIPADCLRIADAKRGDIGNTATRYAQAAFEAWGADAVTVAPYMGRDSVEPFLAFEDKWTILLAATSNPGAEDFEFHGGQDGSPLWRKVLEVSQQYKGAERLMYVVGATRPEWLAEVRAVVPERFLLVPGVGAQGGSLEAVCKAGWAESLAGGLLVNVGRSLMYASAGEDFAEAARTEAWQLQKAMALELSTSR